MKWDLLGLPQIQNSSDLQDSAMLAGTLTVFGWPQKVDCSTYLVGPEYVRHPQEKRYSFSRDQALCLMAGLFVEGNPQLVDRKYVTGKDWFSPSNMGHVARCQGRKANWFQNAWLWLDVIWHCFMTPKEEPNQLLAMMLIADPKYLRFWMKHNTVWIDSINEYFCGWRNEPELAQWMIAKLLALRSAPSKA